ncbi:unnamed protein product, partial [Discosporangium mesarthrocarpum]
AQGYDCTTSGRTATDNWGVGVSDVSLSTPFATGAHGSVVAFDLSHCIEMCCENFECSLAVFNSDEALCYLKAEGALHEASFMDAESQMSTWIIECQSVFPNQVLLKPTACNNKRGVAFSFENPLDMEVLSPGLSWWYDWSPGVVPSAVANIPQSKDIDYVPMLWGEGDLGDVRLENIKTFQGISSFLLGFNEPNFVHQAKLTAKEAASLWSQVKIVAQEYGLDLVSPAVNFCGGDCIEEDPYQWLDDFFEECDQLSGGCGVTHIAVHSYACEVQYLNKHLHGYLKYNKPIWLTEFSCGDTMSNMNEESQAAYLADAITYLEMNPNIYRYAWFIGRGGSDAGVIGCDLLQMSASELTAVGEVFVGLYADLQHCSLSSSSGFRIAPFGIVSTAGPTPAEEGRDVNSEATAMTSVVITNVGGSGYYDQVVGMIDGSGLSCPDFDAACIKEEKCVSGDLVPFDEEMSVVFRGPMNIHNIAWYEEEDGSLKRTSMWNPGSSENIVFMNNLGGLPGCAGMWSICGGNGQSFADSQGAGCAEQPTQFAGKLEGDKEVNIMTPTECMGDEDCGFYRNVGLHGWSGGSEGTKAVVFEVDMPNCGELGFEPCAFNRPAVWALNAKVLRTAQYGCNCRAMGGNGGCGEFDILEAVIGHEYSDMLFTTVYDFKGTGGPGYNKYFLRPNAPTHFAAIFHGGSNAYLQVVQLDSWNYGEAEAFAAGALDSLRASSSEIHSIYDVSSREALEVRAMLPRTGWITGCPTRVSSPVGVSPDYEYVGCFKDENNRAGRDLRIFPKKISWSLTPSMCSSWCASKGGVFFGLQNAKQCWCGGMGGSGPGAHGLATCDKPCTGDASVICGGKLANSVYVVPVDYTLIGCYKDARGNRDLNLLPKATSDYLVPAVCAAHCSSLSGVTVFGLQRGRRCYCGDDSFGKHGPADNCDYPCSGDPGTVCGGDQANSIYALNMSYDIDGISPDIDVMSPDVDEDENVSYKGCYAMTTEAGLLLKGKVLRDSSELDIASCKFFCSHHGYKLFGLQ